MQRLDATRIAVELAGESPIIGGVGNSTFDLVPFDRPRNFYMWNSMGMASSIALGLALARPDLRVIVLDGDGSILMNLGSLATERSSRADNLVHVIWDNGGWEITGGQPAGSPFGVDLEAVARGCGFVRTATVADLEAFRAVITEAVADDQAWVIVGKIAPGDSPYRPSKNCIALRDRFVTALLPGRLSVPPQTANAACAVRRQPACHASSGHRVPNLAVPCWHGSTWSAKIIGPLPCASTTPALPNKSL